MSPRSTVVLCTLCAPLVACAPVAARAVDDGADAATAHARSDGEDGDDIADARAAAALTIARGDDAGASSALIAPALELAPEALSTEPVPPAMPPELAPLEDEPGACRARLARLGVNFRRSGELLGVEDPVVVQPPIAGVRFRWLLEDGHQVPMRMDCRLGLALHAMATALRETWRITDVVHYGTYAYRCVRGVEPCRMSQHSFGLALDLAAFVDADGQSYWVRRDFVPNGRPSCPARAETEGDQLLKDAACWMVQTRAFGVVLTPNFNEIHENHYHIGVSVRSLGEFARRPHVIDPPWVPHTVEEPSPEELEAYAARFDDAPLDALEEFAYGPGAADAVLIDPVTLEPLRASGVVSVSPQTGSALLAPRWSPASGGARPIDCTLRTARRAWLPRPVWTARE